MNAHIVITQDQLDQCLSIRREVFIGEQGVPQDLEIDELDHLDVGRHVLLQDEHGFPIATARLKQYGEDTAKIQRVAVRKHVRGQGYGKEIMRAIEEQARILGFKIAILDAQCHAQGFYDKLGYHVISDAPFLDAGIEHVRMQKELI